MAIRVVVSHKRDNSPVSIQNKQAANTTVGKQGRSGAQGIQFKETWTDTTLQPFTERLEEQPFMCEPFSPCVSFGQK